MKIRLLVVGRLRGSDFANACAEYARRLTSYARFEVVEVRDARLASREAGLEREAEQLLAQVRPHEHLVLLDERGSQMSSVELARFVERQSELVFVIGSGYGVAPAVRARADTLWSLSRLTFPHELARVIVCEQLYRAATILAGHPYHHG